MIEALNFIPGNPNMDNSRLRNYIANLLIGQLGKLCMGHAQWLGGIIIKKRGLPLHFSSFFPKQKSTHLVKDSRCFSHFEVILHKHLSHDRVCLVYAHMTDIPINIGTVICTSICNARLQKKVRFNFGGFLTIFLQANDIKKDPADHK